MSNTCFNTHRILDDVDIVANNAESAMDADIDAKIAHTPDSTFTFSATISTAMFNICTIFADRQLYKYT